MALIDKEPQKKEEKKENNEISCKGCNKKINSNSFILLCEDCFNKSILDTLNKIKDNLMRINTDIKNVENSIEQIKSILSSGDKIHLMVINKLEIDLMNYEAVKEKLLIDKKLNEEAFYVNQKQANKIRKELKWASFNLMNINDSNDNNIN